MHSTAGVQLGFTRALSVSDVEVDNHARMQQLLAWEQGRSRVQVDALGSAANEAQCRRMHVPADNMLQALCQRAMPVSLKAAEVLAKLRYAFYRIPAPFERASLCVL